MQKKIISKTILGIMLAMGTAAVAQNAPTPRNQTPPGSRVERMDGILARLEIASTQTAYIKNNLILEEARYNALENKSSSSTLSLYELGTLSRDIRESKEIMRKAQAAVDSILSNLVKESGVLQSEFGKSIGLSVLSQDAVNQLYEAGESNTQAHKQHLIAQINGETKIFVGPEYVSITNNINSPAGSSTVMEFYEYQTAQARPDFDQSRMVKRIGEFLRFNFGHAGIASAGVGVATIDSLGDVPGSKRIVTETVPARYFSYESASQANNDSKVERALQERQNSRSLRNEPREAVRKVERK